MTHPSPQNVSDLLAEFWLHLAKLSDAIASNENLLSAELLTRARDVLVGLALALNGIVRPDGTRNLNLYLSTSQRRALEKTLVTPAANRSVWIGQAVAMVVIYRWYAPQLVEMYRIPYPGAAEREAWQRLSAALPEWPRTVTTE